MSLLLPGRQGQTSMGLRSPASSESIHVHDRAGLKPTGRLEAGAPSTSEGGPIRRNRAQRRCYFVVTAMVPAYPCAGNRLRSMTAHSQNVQLTDQNVQLTLKMYRPSAGRDLAAWTVSLPKAKMRRQISCSTS